MNAEENPPSRAKAPDPLETSVKDWVKLGNSANDWYSANTADRARNRDPEAARDILESFVAAVDTRSPGTWSGPIPFDDAKFLADCFREILTSRKPLKELHLTNAHPGRTPGKSRTHNWKALGAAISYLKRHCGRGVVNQLSREAGVSAHEIRQCEKQLADPAQILGWDDNSLLTMSRGYRPAIERVLRMHEQKSDGNARKSRRT